MNRRTFAKMAATMGASAAFGDLCGAPSRTMWRERRELFPEGVASGDPDSSSVLLWTRYPRTGTDATFALQCEVVEDRQFEHVVSKVSTPVSAASDWTCRVLVGGLKPARPAQKEMKSASGGALPSGVSCESPVNRNLSDEMPT
jgi:alkaline phosphatase D